MTSDDKKNYPVGYGKPPVSGQFPKGKSGNPKGRPKGSRNLATDLEAELNALVHINENGKRKKINKRQAFVKQMVNKAVNGDPRTMATLLNVLQKLHGKQSGPEGASEGNSPPLTTEEITIEEAANAYQRGN